MISIVFIVKRDFIFIIRESIIIIIEINQRSHQFENGDNSWKELEEEIIENINVNRKKQ